MLSDVQNSEVHPSPIRRRSAEDTPGIYDILVRMTAEMIFDAFDLDEDRKVSVFGTYSA